MRSKRKIVLHLKETDRIHNARLVEYLANKYKERKSEI